MAFCLSLRAHAEVPRMAAVPVAEASRDIQNAVVVTAFVEENQLHSLLDGKTQGSIVVSLQLETKGAFKLYEDKVGFWTETDPALGPGQEWIVETISKPATHRFLDPISKSFKPGFKGQSVFRLRLSAPHELEKPLLLDHRIPLIASFQVCSDTICLFPAALKLDLSLVEKSKVARVGFTARAEQILARTLGTGGGISLSVLGILFLAGLITAFTPCVYPLYPITLGIFSRWSVTSKIPPISLVLSYCLGLTLTYTVVGLVSAASGSVFGSLTQTPTFLIGTGVLILGSALVFSGFVNIPLLDKIQNAFGSSSGANDSKRSSFGMLGQAALMGAGLGLVASPCVGPVLVVILAWLSNHLSNVGASAYVEGAALLSFFGFGMSVPFLVLGHLILRMKRRPQLGHMTPYFKHIGTVLMIVASGFFFVPGIKLLRLRSSSENSASIKYSVLSLTDWTMAKPTVLDFRADWCAACVELEFETFSHPKVAKLFESGEWQFVRVDMTEMNDANKALAHKYGIVGLPAVLIAQPGGQICKALSLFGFEDASRFVDRMGRLSQCSP